MIDAVLLGLTLFFCTLVIAAALTGLAWLACALFDIGEPW